MLHSQCLHFAAATTSAVPPLVGAIAWSKCSRVAALVGGILGQVLGLTAWIVVSISFLAILTEKASRIYDLLCTPILARDMGMAGEDKGQ